MSGGELLVRPPAVAGSFYPDDPSTLEAELDRAFASAAPIDHRQARPKAVVVPHAGYVYSGAVAASAYTVLVPHRATIRRVVLIGPSHFVRIGGLGVTSADAWDTPLGRVRIDTDAREAVLGRPGVVVHDRAHEREHSLEVELPFLQRVLDEFELLPLVVGRADDEVVAAVLDAVWGGPETVIVVSTDLSHYLRYDEAARRDEFTAAAVTSLRPDDVGDDDACGARPLRGLMRAVASRGLGIERLDLRSSGDTAGPKDRVVGYGAFVVA